MAADECNQKDTMAGLVRTIHGHNGTPGLVTRVTVNEQRLNEQGADVSEIKADRLWDRRYLMGQLAASILTLLGVVYMLTIKDLRASVAPHQSQNVSVGTADPADLSQRATLTPDDVARREQVNADTVRRWIAAGKIEPQPVKDSAGTWVIDPAYSVMPHARGNETGTKGALNVHARTD